MVWTVERRGEHVAVLAACRTDVPAEIERGAKEV